MKTAMACFYTGCMVSLPNVAGSLVKLNCSKISAFSHLFS